MTHLVADTSERTTYCGQRRRRADAAHVYVPLEPLRVVTEEEIAAAYRAEAREAGALGEAMTARVAARLGVSVASVK